jgi:hypothetical protein
LSHLLPTLFENSNDSSSNTNPGTLSAQSAVGAGQWIEKAIEEVFAEATAENVHARLPNVQRIKVRHDD